MGRHAIPTKIKAIQGTLRKDRTPKNEPEADLLSIPQPPDNLGEAGKALFVRTCAKLVQLNMLTNAGIPQIERYSFAYQLWINANSHLKPDQMALDVNSSRTWFNILKESHKMMQEFEDRWGLSPASQNKVQWADVDTKKAKEEDEFDI
jgi:P27 family predicted phage terminase small subunit